MPAPRPPPVPVFDCVQLLMHARLFLGVIMQTFMGSGVLLRHRIACAATQKSLWQTGVLTSCGPFCFLLPARKSLSASALPSSRSRFLSIALKACLPPLGKATSVVAMLQPCTEYSQRQCMQAFACVWKPCRILILPLEYRGLI